MPALMLSRAERICEAVKNSGRRMFVLWSGGVDSTAVLLALLEVLGGYHSCLTVLHTASSILEYPKFYRDRIVSGGVDTRMVNGFYLYEAWLEAAVHNVVVSGYPADQLFGSIVTAEHPERYFRDWRGYIHGDAAIGQFEAAFRNYGLPVSTYAEFQWFMNFAARWPVVNADVLCHIAKQEKHTINFFDTPEFQQFSVANFDRHLHIDQTIPRNYKRSLKEFCHSLFPDREYLYGYGKVDSTTYARSLNRPAQDTRTPFVLAVEEGGTVNIREDRKHPLLSLADDEKTALVRDFLAQYRIHP